MPVKPERGSPFVSPSIGRPSIGRPPSALVGSAPVTALVGRASVAGSAPSIGMA